MHRQIATRCGLPVPNVVNASLHRKLNLLFLHDIAPVAAVMGAPMATPVNATLPTSSVSESMRQGQSRHGIRRP
jgi:hypothetical protein